MSLSFQHANQITEEIRSEVLRLRHLGSIPCRVEISHNLHLLIAIASGSPGGIFWHIEGIELLRSANTSSFAVRCIGDVADKGEEILNSIGTCWLVGDRYRAPIADSITKIVHQSFAGRTFAKFFVRKGSCIYQLVLVEEVEGLRSQDIYRPKPCQGCIDYCGEDYGGNQLICGIHPSGPDAETCPDWRGKA